jgi:hypothetical protein
MDTPLENGRGDLRTIAIYQKVILICILLYIALVFVQFAIPQELRPVVLLPIALPLLLASAVFVFLLATKVYGTALGIVLGILTLIPCIGLIALLVINGKATATLKSHGVRVGLLGANLSEIPGGG